MAAFSLRGEAVCDVDGALETPISSRPAGQFAGRDNG